MSKILQRAYFRKQFHDVMRNGQKTATTRSAKLGAVGDFFFAHGALFQITSIEKKTLQRIANDHYFDEGFGLPEHFIRVWIAIHGHYDQDTELWFHRFHRVPPGTLLVVEDEGVAQREGAR
jgi:hypothetical protein